MPSSARRVQLISSSNSCAPGAAPPRLEADLPSAADVGHLGENGEVAAGAVAADGLAKDHQQRAVGRKLQRHRGTAVALDERGGVAMPSGNRIPQLGLLPGNAERHLAGERPRLLVAEEVNFGVVRAAMNPVGIPSTSAATCSAAKPRAPIRGPCRRPRVRRRCAAIRPHPAGRSSAPVSGRPPPHRPDQVADLPRRVQRHLFSGSAARAGGSACRRAAPGSRRVRCTAARSRIPLVDHVVIVAAAGPWPDRPACGRTILGTWSP